MFPLQKLPLTKGSSSPRCISLQVINCLGWDRNWGKVEEVASVETASWLSNRNWYISENQERNKNLVIKRCDLYWTFKKYSFFPKPATQAWGSETQGNCVKKKKKI